MKSVILKLTLLISCLTITLLNSSAQDASELKEIYNLINSAEKEELEIAAELIKDGDSYIDESEELLKEAEDYEGKADSETKKSKKKKYTKKAEKSAEKAYKKYIKGSEIYAEANKVIFYTYRKNLKSIKSDAAIEVEEKMDELIEEAETLFKQALSNRTKAEKEKEKEDEYELCAEADQLENEAITLCYEAYSYYFGWTVIEKEVVVEEVIEEEVIEEEEEEEIVQGPVIVYKVQIAASKVPLEMNKLRQIYPSTEVIFTDIDGEWYKYLVGEYTSYEAAYAAEKKMGVEGSFIVAYKDNVRVNHIREVCNPTKHPAVE